MPGPPENLTLVRVHDRSVDLQWNQPTQPNGEIRGYRVYFMKGNYTSVKTVRSNEPSIQFTLPGLGQCYTCCCSWGFALLLRVVGSVTTTTTIIHHYHIITLPCNITTTSLSSHHHKAPSPSLPAAEIYTCGGTSYEAGRRRRSSSSTNVTYHGSLYFNLNSHIQS